MDASQPPHTLLPTLPLTTHQKSCAPIRLSTVKPADMLPPILASPTTHTATMKEVSPFGIDRQAFPFPHMTGNLKFPSPHRIGEAEPQPHHHNHHYQGRLPLLLPPIPNRTHLHNGEEFCRAAAAAAALPRDSYWLEAGKLEREKEMQEPPLGLTRHMHMSTASTSSDSSRCPHPPSVLPSPVSLRTSSSQPTCLSPPCPETPMLAAASQSLSSTFNVSHTFAAWDEKPFDVPLFFYPPPPPPLPFSFPPPASSLSLSISATVRAVRTSTDSAETEGRESDESGWRSMTYVDRFNSSLLFLFRDGARDSGDYGDGDGGGRSDGVPLHLPYVLSFSRREMLKEANPKEYGALFGHNGSRIAEECAIATTTTSTTTSTTTTAMVALSPLSSDASRLNFTSRFTRALAKLRDAEKHATGHEAKRNSGGTQSKGRMCEEAGEAALTERSHVRNPDTRASLSSFQRLSSGGDCGGLLFFHPRTTSTGTAEKSTDGEASFSTRWSYGLPTPTCAPPHIPSTSSGPRYYRGPRHKRVSDEAAASGGSGDGGSAGDNDKNSYQHERVQYSSNLTCREDSLSSLATTKDVRSQSSAATMLLADFENNHNDNSNDVLLQKQSMAVVGVAFDDLSSYTLDGSW